MARKSKSPGSSAPRPLTGPQRLNKILAAAGLGSRRECEQLIVDGRIEVDGQTVTDLATKVDPSTADVSFDGTSLKAFRPVYYALHKPTGVLSTNRDPSGRTRAIDLLDIKERVFSVGRLDRSSEGLMLLTNDGDLAQRLAHPRFGVQKTYLAVVAGEITQEDLQKLTRGVRLSEGYARVDGIKTRKQRPGSTELEIVLSEGKNREIRRILARLGHKVVALRRLAIGPLKLGLLPVGAYRPLTRDEVAALYSASAHRPKKRRPAPSGEPMRFEKPAQPKVIDDEDEEFFKSSYDDEDRDDEEMIGGEFAEGDDSEFIDLSGAKDVRGTVIAFDDDDLSEVAPDAARGKRPSRPGRGSSSRMGRDSSAPRGRFQNRGSSGRAGAKPRSGASRSSSGEEAAPTGRTASKPFRTERKSAGPGRGPSAGAGAPKGKKRPVGGAKRGSAKGSTARPNKAGFKGNFKGKKSGPKKPPGRSGRKGK